MSSAVGSALKRHPDGTVVAPKVRQKNKGKIGFSSWKDKRARAAPVEEEASDSSFDSSDSEYDSSQASQAGGDDDDEMQWEASWAGCLEGKEEEEEVPVPEEELSQPRKRLGFKDWAMKQLNAAKGYDEPRSEEPPEGIPYPPSPPKKKRKVVDPSKPVEMRGPLGRDLKLPNTAFVQLLEKQGGIASSLKVKAVTVDRILASRRSSGLLPIVTEEQPIMEAVMLNVLS
ncbi:hypothetical protein C0991_001817 [Blastosporella zonata]|nr:hypothetical protein C0991_001817 [Blastosporella zonata]